MNLVYFISCSLREQPVQLIQLIQPFSRLANQPQKKAARLWLKPLWMFWLASQLTASQGHLQFQLTSMSEIGVTSVHSSSGRSGSELRTQNRFQNSKTALHSLSSVLDGGRLLRGRVSEHGGMTLLCAFVSVSRHVCSKCFLCIWLPSIPTPSREAPCQYELATTLQKQN